MENYQYSPLVGLSTIRVLDLERTDDGGMRCKITHGAIGELGLTALSYAWGSNEKPFELEVTALGDLADSVEIYPKRFWIDQICIDQDDVNERSSQVAMMGKIYSQANGVITYVGPAEPGDDEAIELLLKIHHHFEPFYGTPEVEDRDDTEPVPHHLRYRVDPSSPAYCRVEDMSRGEWTRRLWMVQENIIHELTVMLWGSRVLPWLALPSYEKLILVNLLPVPVLRPSSDGYLAVQLRSTRMARWSEGVDLRLFHLLSSFQDCFCTYPGDKVFALLGIADDSDLLGIEVDYSQPAREVLIQTASRIINKTEKLDILLNADVPYKVDSGLDLPSWVPGWTGRKTASLLIFELGVQASKGSSICRVPGETDSTETLKLEGIRVGTIKDDLGSFGDCWEFYKEFCNFQAVMQTVIERLGLMDREAAEAVLCSTIVAQSHWPVAGGQHHTMAARALRAFSLSLSVGWNRAENMVLAQSEEDEHFAAYIHLNAKTRYRSMYFTCTGRLCLATKDCLPGDIVAVLFGGRALYVLRPAGEDRFAYVGAAFIYGLMHGEAMDDFQYTRSVFHII
ncbi:heterokaryon incompatibility protein-domain-containing protein [Podospora australis]|uniref:Heterokaryon incompatibility protein-domain-containing protein n=1 Tax=Podospora australis TaxID=1536484 RepID=A0AAN6WQ54_9PEZI|nr:heterokaryon incompatibility protein-domain-containing protein [Podospora australis]